MIGVVIPTVDGRERSYERCYKAYLATSPPDTTFVTIRNAPSCGKAWIDGAKALSTCPGVRYLHFTADDLEPLPRWWEPAVEAVNQEIIPAPVVYNGLTGKFESGGGDLNAPNHVRQALDEDWRRVDFGSIPFLTWEMWSRIGMRDIHYYSDVWISFVGRAEGYETKLRRGYSFRHYWESAGRGAGLDMNDRNTMDYLRFREEFLKLFPERPQGF